MKPSTLLALHTAAAAALLAAAGCASVPVQSRGHGALFGKVDPNQTEGDPIQPGQTVAVEKPAAKPETPAVEAPKANVPAAPKPAETAPVPPAKPVRPASDVGRPGTYPEFVNVPDGLQGRKGVLAEQVNSEGKKFPKPVSDAKPVVVGPAPTGPALPKIKTVHVVQSGETLGHIAQKYKVPTSELLKVNSMGDPNRIRVGQKINIPEYTAPARHPHGGTAPRKTVTAPEGGSVHVVQKGEMISGIAHKYGIKTGDVLRANGLTEETAKKIHVGQQLAIPAKTSANAYVPSSGTAPRPTAVMQVQDTQPVAPVTAPPKAEPERVQPVSPRPVPAPAPHPVAVPPVQPVVPQQPAVPTVQPSVPGAAAAPATVKTYVVQEGDDLLSIASRFNTSALVLRQLNNLTLPGTVSPGMTIYVP